MYEIEWIEIYKLKKKNLYFKNDFLQNGISFNVYTNMDKKKYKTNMKSKDNIHKLSFNLKKMSSVGL